MEPGDVVLAGVLRIGAWRATLVGSPAPHGMEGQGRKAVYRPGGLPISWSRGTRPTAPAARPERRHRCRTTRPAEGVDEVHRRTQFGPAFRRMAQSDSRRAGGPRAGRTHLGVAPHRRPGVFTRPPWPPTTASSVGRLEEEDGVDCYLLALLLQKPACAGLGLVDRTEPARAAQAGSRTNTGMSRSVFSW